MVDARHGVPCTGLVPWARLTARRLGPGFSGPVGADRWLYLWPKTDWQSWPEDWELRGGTPGEKPRPLARLDEYTDADGRPYLAGGLGLAYLLAFPGGVWDKSKKAYVTLYWAVSPYVKEDGQEQGVRRAPPAAGPG
jgi:hypothetical protein